MTVEEARAAGAMALFAAKYGEQVKVYTIGDFSKEVCGGPHVENTGELGRFTILKEESSRRRPPHPRRARIGRSPVLRALSPARWSRRRRSPTYSSAAASAARRSPPHSAASPAYLSARALLATRLRTASAGARPRSFLTELLLFIVRRQQVHAEGLQRFGLLQIRIPQPDQAVGIPGGHEDLAGQVELFQVEQLVALADQGDPLALGQPGGRGGLLRGYFEEAFLRAIGAAALPGFPYGLSLWSPWWTSLRRPGRRRGAEPGRGP